VIANKAAIFNIGIAHDEREGQCVIVIERTVPTFKRWEHVEPVSSSASVSSVALTRAIQAVRAEGHGEVKLRMSDPPPREAQQRLQALAAAGLRRIAARKNGAQRFAKRRRRESFGQRLAPEEGGMSLADLGVEMEIAEWALDSLNPESEPAPMRTLALHEDDALALYAWVARQNRCPRAQAEISPRDRRALRRVEDVLDACFSERLQRHP
jgi:hypothetical protein